MYALRLLLCIAVTAPVPVPARKRRAPRGRKPAAGHPSPPAIRAHVTMCSGLLPRNDTFHSRGTSRASFGAGLPNREFLIETSPAATGQQAVVQCIVVKKNDDAGPPTVLPATVRARNGTFFGRFVARENGTFFPHCILLYDHLERFGDGTGVDFRPQTERKPETLAPLATTPATVVVATAPSLADLKRCDARGTTFGDGRWLPRAHADAEIVGTVPVRFEWYWVPYNCRLVVAPHVDIAKCPALGNMVFVGDSVQSMIFNAVAKHLGLSKAPRDKTAEHAAEARGVYDLWTIAGKGVRMVMRGTKLPVRAGATAYGSYGVTDEDDYLPGCGGQPLAFVNWGLHDLECGQPCRLGYRPAATVAAYARGVLGFAQAALARRGNATNALVVRTLLPKFGELGCCENQPVAKCFSAWRWKHVDFKAGRAAGGTPETCPHAARSANSANRLTVDRAAVYSARLLRDFVARHPRSLRVLDAYPVILSSPTSWLGMRDTTHPAEGSVESDVITTMFLNLACQPNWPPTAS